MASNYVWQLDLAASGLNLTQLWTLNVRLEGQRDHVQGLFNTYSKR